MSAIKTPLIYEDALKIAAQACPDHRLYIATALMAVDVASREQERERAARLMEGDDGDAWDPRFCRVVDHVQGVCDCEERAAAIRDPEALSTGEPSRPWQQKAVTHAPGALDQLNASLGIKRQDGEPDLGGERPPVSAHVLATPCVRCGFTLSAHADGYCPSGPIRRRFTERPRVVCLCGSTRFRDAWVKAHREESLAGRIVLSVGVMIHAGDEPIRDDSPEKRALDELHLRKIDLSEEVFVLNVGGYIGESTRREIAYAEDHGKPLRFLEPRA